MNKFFLFILFYFFLIYSAYGQAKQGTYLVGVEEVNYPPFYDFSASDIEHLRPSFTRDLLSHFFEIHKIPYRFIALPIKRFDKWYIENNIDFKFPDNKRWRVGEDAKLPIIFSQPVLKLTAGTYVLKKHGNINVDDVKTLVTITGFFPSLWVNHIASGKVKLVEENTPMSIVKHILFGNAVATNIDQNVISHTLNKLGMKRDIVLAKNIKHESYFYHFSTIKHPEILALFDQFLLNNQAFVSELKQKYKIVE